MILFLVLFLVILYFIVTWSIQSRKNRLLHLPNQLDLINLGSTYAFYDFSYQNLEIIGANLANIAQYLEMDFIILRKFIRRIKKHGKVLIVLPDFVFATGKSSYNRNVYFEALRFWEIPGFSIRMWLVSVWKAAKEPFTHAYHLAEHRWDGYIATKEEKEIHAQKRVEDWERKLGIPNVLTTEITDTLIRNIATNINIVCDMIDLCRQNEVEPVLIIPPVSEIMHKLVSDQCLEVYLRTPIREIIEKKQIRMYDYMTREELSHTEFYLNSDCLNADGQKIFMRLILQDIYPKSM